MLSPAEAGAIELEEPNWRERFTTHCDRWPQSSCADEWGYEATLKDWRRFHATPVFVDGQEKKQPAPAIDGMIALAKLRLFAPRRLLQETPRDGATGYQFDDHMWLQVAGEQWRIVGVEDRTLILKLMFAGEEKQIDLSKAKWGRYVENAAAMLEAMR
jgi:hypothetical protein